MVLIEPSKPKKFVDDILQAVTPYPVKWFGELEDGLYRSATMGISRDFGISEIKVEMVNWFLMIFVKTSFKTISEIFLLVL